MSTGDLNMAIAAATILMGISLVVLIIFDYLENGKSTHW
jgi:ABC-type sulfate transport system permease component